MFTTSRWGLRKTKQSNSIVMAAITYVPRTDRDKSIWLKNFALKFVNYSTLFGFVLADSTSVNNDAGAFAWILDSIETFKSEFKERISFKSILRDGPLGSTLGAYPSLPTLPATPTAVAAGIFPRISGIVKRIKAHPAYTVSIGKDLGIEGVDVAKFLSVSDKPTLSLTKSSGKVTVKYTKGKAGGIYLYCRRGTETDFTLLAVVTKSTYNDTRPNLVNNQPETREYYACFMKNDEVQGNDSDVAEVVV